MSQDTDFPDTPPHPRKRGELLSAIVPRDPEKESSKESILERASNPSKRKKEREEVRRMLEMRRQTVELREHVRKLLERFAR